MSQHSNELGQPIGAPVPDWRPVARPPRTPMQGTYCRLEPIDVERHAADLCAAFNSDREGRIWTYMGYGPLPDETAVRDWMTKVCLGDDPLFHTIIEASSRRALGVASYLRIEPAVGVIEVGHINYTPALQRTRAATETMYLMMRRVFAELGYRRYEWKCDSLNAGSRRAAERYGFRYEGLFRQATLYKGRNRDTAWFSIIDSEWPVLQRAYETWLAADNFDAQGQQRSSLGQQIAAARGA